MGKYTAALRPVVSNIQSKAYFLWISSLSTAFSGRICLNVLREVLSYFPTLPSSLPCLSQFSLNLYSLNSHTSNSIVLSKSLPTQPVYLSLDSTRLFACGGSGNSHIDVSRKSAQPSGKTAFVVFVSGKVVELPGMRQARSGQGLVLYKSAVFVFGGHSYDPKPHTLQSIQTAEKLQIVAPPVWERLPNSNSSHFASSPVLLRDKIYLCSANPKCIEVFDPLNSQFSLKRLSSKVTSVEIAYPAQDRIVLVGSNCTSYLHIKGEDIVVEARPMHAEIQVRSFTSPVIAEGRVWVWTCKSRILAFDVLSGEPVEIDTR